MTKEKKTRQEGGFTLLELLVVMAILGMLAALVGPQVLNQLGGAKSKSARIQIRDLEQALELYRLDVGRYPSSEDGLSALVARPEDIRGWNGSYLKKSEVPADPWGNEYAYRLLDTGLYELVSYGSDGVPGGSGESQDIEN